MTRNPGPRIQQAHPIEEHEDLDEWIYAQLRKPRNWLYALAIALVAFVVLVLAYGYPR